ncbi:MAG TPA: MBL fold metallo-hydrolase [Candidatus Acidoferrum sp.]|nr:MBL fold metallo-hydrolase [Candidatus Acidoferrum sp.]
MSVRRLGDIAIARIVEREEPAFAVSGLLPDATPETLAPHRHWLEPKALDPATGLLILPIQSYVVRTRRHNILIDGCLGEDKTCRWQMRWHKMRDLRFLSDLAALGLAPEDIDFVLCTHLHGDHVGWNTRLVNGRWVPTFPNARYMISQRELAHWEEYNKVASAEAYEECIDESVLPVVAAGQALLVDEDHAIDDEVWLEPLPGHTPGHFGVHLRSHGAEAIMIGDLMHSPVQCAEPDWRGGSDEDPALARQVRRRFLETHAETDHLVLTAHFPSPSIGHIRRAGKSFRFAYDPAAL